MSKTIFDHPEAQKIIQSSEPAPEKAARLYFLSPVFTTDALMNYFNITLGQITTAKERIKRK